jgi:peptidoglycan-associated lipoprotein
MGSRTLPVSLLALLLALSGWGCSAKGLRKDKTAAAAKAAAEQGQDAGRLPGDVSAEEASLRYKDFKPVPELKTVLFEYDRAYLSEETRDVLKKNAEWLRSNPGQEIQLQGHCDERGTTEYNLALGQRRAQAVRDYYKALGIGLKRMSSISYGEEQPVCSEPDEECWQRNRRAETLVHRRSQQETQPKTQPKRRNK